MIKRISYGFLALSCLISINSINGVFKREQKTPLMLAFENGHFNKAEELLDNGANPNYIFERSPLITYFAENGNATAINILLSHGANIDTTESTGRSAITYASVYGHIEALRQLLNANPSYKADNGAQRGPHHEAAVQDKPNQPIIIRMLNDYFAPKGIGIDVRSKSQLTPLMYAAGAGRLKITETCLELGASQYCQDNQGRTAVMHCLAGMEEKGMHSKITSTQKLEQYKQFQSILTLLNRNPETRSTLCNNQGKSARDVAIQTKQGFNWDGALTKSDVSPFSRDRVAPARVAPAIYTITHLPTLSAYLPRNYR